MDSKIPRKTIFEEALEDKTLVKLPKREFAPALEQRKNMASCLRDRKEERKTFFSLPLSLLTLTTSS